MIVDIHVHPEDTDEPARIDAMLEVARRTRIDRLVLLGAVGQHGYTPTPEGIRSANDRSLQWMRHRPDACLGFCYLNPAHDPGFSREELQRCVAEGMLGIKLWVAVNARDPRLDPILELAAEQGLPVLFHAWYKTVGLAAEESSPADIADLARRHPTVPLIMAHVTGGGQRGVADVAELPNVLVDTSGSQPVAGIIEYAVRELGEERVLFGSDAYGRDFAVALARVEAAALTPRQRRLVLGGNAARLLMLEELS
ncbi:MAG: amidohydrolase family protein [Armatimonadetes bacterium]|nr:amidohydrolase family protein [Armatimonadota bacterium]